MMRRVIGGISLIWLYRDNKGTSPTTLSGVLANLFFCASIQFNQKLVQGFPVQQPAAAHDGVYLRRVSNVVERIRIEQHEISNLAFFNGAEFLHLAKKARGVNRGSLQCIHWTETSFD